MSLERAVNPTTPGMSLALVEQIVDRAWHRYNTAHQATLTIADFETRCVRSAVLYEREARWWGVLLRYTSPFSPYYSAVLAAQQLAHDRAQECRQFAANAAQRRADAVLRAAGGVSERVA